MTQKSQIRHYTNSRGQGTLFNMNLLDESGEIRATAFKEVVEKFYEMIEVNKVSDSTSTWVSFILCNHVTLSCFIALLLFD